MDDRGIVVPFPAEEIYLLQSVYTGSRHRLFSGTDCSQATTYLKPGIERSGRKGAHSPGGRSAWNCTSTPSRLNSSMKPRGVMFHLYTTCGLCGSRLQRGVTACTSALCQLDAAYINHSSVLWVAVSRADLRVIFLSHVPLFTTDMVLRNEAIIYWLQITAEKSPNAW